jgi:hypothetical protein
MQGIGKAPAVATAGAKRAGAVPGTHLPRGATRPDPVRKVGAT